MIENPKKCLEKAKEKNSAVGHFNVNNLEMVKAVTQAAEEKETPVFVAVTETAIDFAGLDFLTSIVKTAAQDIDTNLFLHLDHGKSFPVIKEAVKAGFSSIMYDGSSLPFKENVKKTKKVRDLIEDRDIGLEAEIGHVGRLDDKTEMLTQPEKAKEFAQKTGVDSLAVAVGTVHGHVKDQNIDYQRLEEISKKVSIPLVIHGTSGLRDEQIKKLRKAGANKFNIDTDIRLAFMEGVKQYINETDPRRGLRAAMKEMQAVVEKKINYISGK